MNKATLSLLLIALLGFSLGLLSPEKKIDFLVARASNHSNDTFKGGIKNGSWKTFVGIAENDQPAFVRSIVARIGLGANTNEEAMYWNAYEDINGDRLVSDRNYKVTVPAEMHVREFWSLTVYGADHFLCANEADKYAVSSFHELHKNQDSSITIYVGQDEMGARSNWLPTSTKAEPISLTLRCYNPTAKMIHEMGSITLPSITPL